MVLIDTSVWIRFLAGRAPYLAHGRALLAREQVLAHDLVYGELLLGDSGKRRAWLADYNQITHAAVVPHADVVTFARARQLAGRGIGWIDTHLVAAALVEGAPLWTADQRLAAVAEALQIAYRPVP